MAQPISKTFTIWEVLGLATFAVAMWCVWGLFHAPLQYPGPNPEAGRFLCGFLVACYLMLVFMAVRFRAWVMMVLCGLGALVCIGLLLTQFG